MILYLDRKNGVHLSASVKLRSKAALTFLILVSSRACALARCADIALCMLALLGLAMASLCALLHRDFFTIALDFNPFDRLFVQCVETGGDLAD